MQLRDDYERFVAANLQIVAIGQGSAARTKEFRAQLETPFPLLADPRRAAYNAYGLLHTNLRREASTAAVGRGVRAAMKYGVGAVPDQDMLQLGGIFIVGTDGVIRYAHRQQRMSDVPPNDALLAVAD